MTPSLVASRRNPAKIFYAALLLCHILPQANALAPLPPSKSTAIVGERRAFLKSAATVVSAAAVASALLMPPEPAAAAPPFAVMAEELGYFPVTNSEGTTLYVPARSKRVSSPQAVKLAEYLRKSGAVMFGAYWCPHCSRQKDMFGREAWGVIQYVECSPKGYGADARRCAKKDVDGYPTWRFGNGKVAAGEMSLKGIVEMSGYKGEFDASLEEPLPAGSGSCR